MKDPPPRRRTHPGPERVREPQPRLLAGEPSPASMSLSHRERPCGGVGGVGAAVREIAGGFIAALSCLDHLRAVGPPYFVNQVVQRNASGPTAFKWSKQIGRVTTCETPSHHARRSAGGGGSKGGAPEPPPTSPSPPRFPAPSSPPLSMTLRITPGKRIQAPPNNLPGGEGLIRTGRHHNLHAPRLQNHP